MSIGRSGRGRFYNCARDYGLVSCRNCSAPCPIREFFSSKRQVLSGYVALTDKELTIGEIEKSCSNLGRGFKN